LRQLALKRELLGKTQPMRTEGCMLSTLQQKHQGQQDAEVLFTKAITNITGASPWRRNGDMPVGY
jgi:hypothetical protein